MAGKKILVIVESPSKIKTLSKILGPQYIFASSVGHIRDLPIKSFGVDLENNFEPQYEVLEDKKKIVQEIRKKAKECDIVCLSPDPDREGEAIAWHITQVLPKGIPYQRVVFHSITKDAVTEAFRHPRDIDHALVDAQQARRVLDRVVGYTLSPLVARRVHGGGKSSLSAGRVQSSALKIVVQREEAIESFKPIEFWKIAIQCKNQKGDSFEAFLHSVEGKRLEKEKKTANQCTLSNKEVADKLLEKIKKSSFVITKVSKKEKKRNPVPPFTTSTLQQEASRHFRFSAQRTMSIAQGLYEGVETPEGADGLITYMRTDSVQLSPEALAVLRPSIEKLYGKEYLAPTPRRFHSKKSAQEAHEAIRPTDPRRSPESLRSHLSDEQWKLYSLIWKRTLASQMTEALYDTLSVDITSEGLLFRATGSTLRFPGFLKVYEEKKDEEEEGKESLIPPLEEGEQLDLLQAKALQSFTQPPPRFSEASLVKELEKLGIGRPSTYASIMGKIQNREFTVKEKGRLKPSELGRVVIAFLNENFQKVMDIGFTAEMEHQLEEVAREKLPWKSLIKNFWEAFEPSLIKAKESAFVPKVLTDLPCPECSKQLQKIWSHARYFYGCSGYPDCKYSVSEDMLNFNKEDYAEDFSWDQDCPQCQQAMQLRHGRYGAFLGCSQYPECKGIVNIPKKGEDNPQDLPSCPALSCSGQIQIRRSRFGKTFFSCSSYPDCDVIVNQVDELESKYVDYEQRPYVRKSRKGAKKTTAKKSKAAPKKAAPKKKRKMPSFLLSTPLSSLLETKELTRGDVLKEVWVYIRKHSLQDPKDKRNIIPDKALAAITGADVFGMFALSGKLSPHLEKKPKDTDEA